MDEQLKALLEGINPMKSGQEETKERMEKGQREMQKERPPRNKKGLENVQKCQEELKNSLEEKINCGRQNSWKNERRDCSSVEEKVGKKIEKIKEQVEERIEGVAENFSLISQCMEDLEKKLLAGGNENKSKSVPVSAFQETVLASPVPVTAYTGPVKLSTYDGKTNWEVYKTQFSIFSEANGWTEEAKAFS
ncbi:uncharacterized protein TNCV_167511 [Trichonephila clavipes]|nr:uncharacterized protein TNCV_167511 [Trichonephila clavipes]